MLLQMIKITGQLPNVSSTGLDDDDEEMPIKKLYFLRV